MLNVTLVTITVLSAFATVAAQFQDSVMVRQQVTTGALITCGAITAFTGWRRARHSSGRRQRAWRILSAAVVCGALGNSWSLGVHLSSLPNNWSALTDLLLWLALTLCLVGLVLFPESRRRRTDIARLVFDGLVVGGSVLFMSTVIVFPRLLAGRDPSLDTRLQFLVLPVMDVLIATLATLLITRSGRSGRLPLLCVGCGFWLYAISDMAYAVREAIGLPPLGSWWDLGWLCGYLLLTLAALQTPADRGLPDEPEEASPLLSTVVVFALFLTATGLSVAQGAQASLNGGRGIVWVLLIVAVVGRQILLVIDNESLRHDLERRVRLRTHELNEITVQQELLLTSVADGIYGVNRDGHITRVNIATIRLLRRSEDELMGRHAHALFHAPRGDGTPFPARGCYISEAIDSGLTVTGEEDVYVRGDGRHIVVEATASPLVNESGNTGAVVVFRDVSQRHHVDQMKREFVSLVSHELRTPLTSIRGALKLVAAGTMGTIPDPANRMIQIATSGTERLGRLVNDILDLERIDSGVMAMNIAEYDAADICSAAVADTLGMAKMVAVTIETGRCRGQVLTDRDRTIQALVNLLGNALRFSESGSSVTIEARPRDEWIRFSVSDHGRGIPHDQLESIFGRFQQVDASDAREKEGTGLGLAICRTIAERLQGRIWAESTYGEGATFHLELPAAAHSRPCPASQRQPQTSPAPPETGHRRTDE